MKIKKFNESIDSDEKILIESSTIITFEFEDIEFSVDTKSREILFELNNWIVKYGDLTNCNNFLKFNEDYVKFMKLFHNFINSLIDDYQIYIEHFFNPLDKNFFILLNYLKQEKGLEIIKNKTVDKKLTKSILNGYYNIHFNEIMEASNRSSNSTILLNGVKDFNKIDLNKLIKDLIKSDNKLVSIGLHWLSIRPKRTISGDSNWDSFSEFIEDSEKPWDYFIKSIPENKIKLLMSSSHINISLKFENSIRIR